MLLCIIYKFNIAQTNSGEQEVKILNWGKRGLRTASVVTNEAKDTIIKQIGLEEYNKVLKFSTYNTWPNEMVVVFKYPKKSDSLARQQCYDKLDSLKLYKIATFPNNFQGKNWGNLVLLRVPYEKNKNWDVNSKWDIVYFIIYEQYIAPTNTDVSLF